MVRLTAVLTAALSQSQQHEQILTLVQRFWQHASTRDEAVQILPLTAGLIHFRHDLGEALFNVFQWVDDFLKEDFEGHSRKATS